MAQGNTTGVPIDIDPTLAANSDFVVPSQKAVKSYVASSLPVSVYTSVNFGTSFTDKAQTVVTGLTWAASGMKVSPQVMTPTSTDPDEMYLLDMKPVISDIVNGVGFTVTVYSQPEAKGTYNVMIVGGL